MAYSERTVDLINSTQMLLEMLRHYLERNPDIPESQLRQIELRLFEAGREVQYFTGPAGYDPRSFFHLCATCGKYRVS